MPNRIAVALVTLILAVETAAALFQWEYWPVSGHALYSERFDYHNFVFHRYVLSLTDGRKEANTFREIRASGDHTEELDYWCSKIRSRKNFGKLESVRSYFADTAGGEVEYRRNEPETPCGS